MSDHKTSPYANGILVPLGGADAAKALPGGAIVHLGGTYYDARPYFQAMVDLGANIASFGANPYDPRALLRMQAMSKQILPALQKARAMHPTVREHVAPMVAGLASYLKNSQQLIAMRLRTSHKIGRAPKILVPISMSIAAGATLAAVQVRNPYLGATGGATGMYQFPWTITSFRTSNGESGALLPIRLTQFLIGGHDYVAASLAGLTYTAGGAPATQGWAAAAFAETKRSHWQTEVQPWNVIAQHGGGTGFGSIMTETGFLQIGVFNGGAQTYVDTYSVYCNATLCGNPFGDAKWTQVDAFRKAFAPLALQAPLAMRLAGDASSWVKQAGVPVDDSSYGQNDPFAQFARMQAFGPMINGLVEDAESLAIGSEFYDPSSMGLSLQDGASYG